MISNKKTAVILFNLGGPDRLENVRQFLFNLFNDSAIIRLPQPFRFFLARFISRKRGKKAQEIYRVLGGKSPLLDFTLAQADALERELSFSGNFRVFVAMRYSAPRAAEVVKKVREYAPDRIILLPLYPQFSSTTSGSSIKEFAEKFTAEARSDEKKPTVKIICCYPTEPDFISAHGNLIKQKISEIYDDDLQKLRFLFSAHGLPQKIVNDGDPYVAQVEATSQAVVKNLAETLCTTSIDFKICFQSKVGRLQWTSPSLECEIKRCALDKKIPVIIPISFVSDHAETLVELDIEYREIAEKLGIKNYLRVPSLNVNSQFINALKALCSKPDNDDETALQFFSGTKKQRFCAKKFKFCPNPNQCAA